jgi:hypothetical protein
MVPYTLAGTSLRGARAFFYRACVFEALHLVPLLILGGLSAMRWTEVRPDLALENTLVNLGLNVYPILHHRHTRSHSPPPAARRRPERAGSFARG